MNSFLQSSLNVNIPLKFQQDRKKFLVSFNRTRASWCLGGILFVTMVAIEQCRSPLFRGCRKQRLMDGYNPEWLFDYSNIGKIHIMFLSINVNGKRHFCSRIFHLCWLQGIWCKEIGADFTLWCISSKNHSWKISLCITWIEIQ